MKIPEGYALVPIKPTEQMLNIASWGIGPGGDAALMRKLGKVYENLLEMAPQPDCPPVSWGSPKTIGQLIAQLETMNSEMPVKSAFRIKFPSGEEKVAAHHVSLSYEVVGGRWLIGGHEAGPGQEMALMFWVKHDDRSPVDIELPDYNEQAMGCGVEDRGITDRYEACRYGFEQAVEMVASAIEAHGPLFDLPDQSEIQTLRLLVESHQQVEEHLSKQIDILTTDRDSAKARIARMVETLEVVSGLRGTLAQHGILERVERDLGLRSDYQTDEELDALFKPGNGNAARRRAEGIKVGCDQPQAHPARCGCEGGKRDE